MGIKNQLEKKIALKSQEIADLDNKIREARAYIQAMQEVLRMMPKDDGEEKQEKTADQILRSGSDMAKVRTYLLKVGKPQHITNIIKGIGRENTKKARSTVSGSLGNYARREEIFTRTAPNTFGLIEFGNSQQVLSEEDELPDYFGLDDDTQDNDNNAEDIPF